MSFCFVNLRYSKLKNRLVGIPIIPFGCNVTFILALS